jgi:hypothetical protein
VPFSRKAKTRILTDGVRKKGAEDTGIGDLGIFGSSRAATYGFLFVDCCVCVVCICALSCSCLSR